MDYRKTTYGDPGVISRYDGDGTLLMVRDDADRATGFDVNGYLNASTWLGDNFVQVNTRLAYMPRDIVITSTLLPQVEGEDSGQIVFDSDRDITIVELGALHECMKDRIRLGRHSYALVRGLELAPAQPQRPLQLRLFVAEALGVVRRRTHGRPRS